MEGVTTTNDLLRYFINVSANLSIGRLLSKAELGVFSVARNLANLPSDKIGELLNHLGLASLAKVQNDRETAGHYLKKSLQLAGLILFPVYFGLCAVAPDFISLVLSEKWAGLIIPFQILCLSSPFRLLSELLATSVTAIGEPVRNSHALLYTLLLLPLLIASIEFGVEGASWAWFTISLFSFGIHLKCITNAFKLTSASILRCLFPGIFCSVIMLTVLYIGRVYSIHDLPELISFALIVISGVTIFLSLQMLLFRSHFLTSLRWLRH